MNIHRRRIIIRDERSVDTLRVAIDEYHRKPAVNEAAIGRVIRGRIGMHPRDEHDARDSAIQEKLDILLLGHPSGCLGAEHRRVAAQVPPASPARARAWRQPLRSLRLASAHWPVVRYRHSRWLQPRSRVWPKFSFPAWEFLCAAHAKASRSSSRRAPQSRRRPLPSMTRANSAVLGCGRLTSGLPALLNPEK